MTRVRRMLSGACWRSPDGRTIWPLWGHRSRTLDRTPEPWSALPWWLVRCGRLQDRYADQFAVLPLAPFFWGYLMWKQYRWCLEWWGIERGWFGVTEEGGYLAEGRWAGIGERFTLHLLPPDECKPPWNTPDRFAKFGFPTGF